MAKKNNPLIEDNYQEELLDLTQIQAEAKRCLNCKAPRCSLMCPMQCEPHRFIALLNSGNIEEAAKFVYEKNLLSYICGHICPSEKYCEKNCLRGRIDRVVKVREIHRYLASLNRRDEEEFQPLNNKHALIIGGGPVGLVIANKLAKRGLKSTILEKSSYLGGALRQQIPAFRLPSSVIDHDLNPLLNERIEIKLKMTFGKDVTYDDVKDKYDAIIFTTGLDKPRTYDFMLDHPKVILAQDFLRMCRHEREITTYDKIAVIGGSDTAMDCLACAKKIAKEVVGVYRREKERLRANKESLEMGFKAADDFIFNRTPLRFDEAGNMVFKNYYGEEEETIPASLYVLAIGVLIEDSYLKDFFEIEDGVIKNKKIPNAFYAGDMSSSDKTLVSALSTVDNVIANLLNYLSLD